MFAIKCYGLPGHPFTHFKECKTLSTAKKAAAQKLADGWRMVEVLKRSARAEMDTKIEWELIKKMGIN